MADSEVRQKEWTILETERLIRKIEQCEGMPAKLILMRHFYESGMRAGEIAMREKAVKVARDEGDTPRGDGGNCARQDACDNVARAIRALPLSGAEESKK